VFFLAISTARLVVSPCVQAEQDRLEYLLDRLENADSPKVRVAAALALGKMEEPDAFGKMFRALLNDGSEAVRLALIDAFASQEYYEAIVAIAEACFKKFRLPGKTAEQGLNLLRDKATAFDLSAWRRLLRVRQKKSPMAPRAAFILGAVGDKKAIGGLGRMIFKGNVAAKIQAARGLGLVGGRKAVKILKVALKRSRKGLLKTELARDFAIAEKGGFKPSGGLGIEYPPVVTPASYMKALKRLSPVVHKEEQVDVKSSASQKNEAPHSIPGVPFVDWDDFEGILHERMTGILNHCVKKVPREMIIKGDLKLTFELSKQGRPVSIEIDADSLGYEPLSKCLQNGVSKSRFDSRPDHVSTISYDFTVRTGKRIVDFSNR